MEEPAGSADGSGRNGPGWTIPSERLLICCHASHTRIRFNNPNVLWVYTALQSINARTRMKMSPSGGPVFLVDGVTVEHAGELLLGEVDRASMANGGGWETYKRSAEDFAFAAVLGGEFAVSPHQSDSAGSRLLQKFSGRRRAIDLPSFTARDVVTDETLSVFVRDDLTNLQSSIANGPEYWHDIVRRDAHRYLRSPDSIQRYEVAYFRSDALETHVPIDFVSSMTQALKPIQQASNVSEGLLLAFIKRCAVTHVAIHWWYGSLHLSDDTIYLPHVTRANLRLMDFEPERRDAKNWEERFNIVGQAVLAGAVNGVDNRQQALDNLLAMWSLKSYRRIREKVRELTLLPKNEDAKRRARRDRDIRQLLDDIATEWRQNTGDVDEFNITIPLPTGPVESKLKLRDIGNRFTLRGAIRDVARRGPQAAYMRNLQRIFPEFFSGA